MQKKIQEAKKIMSSIPDIREEKVAKIKAQIENGTYQVEEKKLATKMIKESLLNELL
jgi:negative regulator of flagellin synthesis FlgM